MTDCYYDSGPEDLDFINFDEENTDWINVELLAEETLKYYFEDNSGNSN